MLSTNAELARLLNTTPQAVSNAVRRGRLVKEGNGLIDLENPGNKKFIDRQTAQRKRGPKIAAKNARKKALSSAATRQAALDTLDPPWPEYVPERGEYYTIKDFLAAVAVAWKFEAEYMPAAVALWDLGGDAAEIAEALAELLSTAAYNGDLVMSEFIWQDGDPTCEAPGPGLIHVDNLPTLSAADPHYAAREGFERDMLADLPSLLAGMPDSEKRSQTARSRFKTALALIPPPLAHNPRP